MPELADVVIIGGGICGAMLACELARRAQRVTLMESSVPGRGATGGSFAWVNATAKDADADYHRLNALSMARYEELAAEWGAAAMGLHGGGALFWRAEGGDLHGRADRLQALGYPVALLNRAEMQALEPQVRFDEGAEGLFAPADGWVETPRLLRFLAERIRERGVEVRPQCPVTGLTSARDGSGWSVQSPQGMMAARRIVIAAGAQSPEPVAMALGVAVESLPVFMRRIPGILMETAPGSAQGQAGRILYPPDAGGLHLRPTPGGGLLIGASDVDDALAPDAFEPPSSAVPALLRALAHFPGLSAEALLPNHSARVCARPVPADGRPVVGPLQEARHAYLMLTHSGVTLAPLLAQLLAEEIATGRMPPLLAPYRPIRFGL